MTDTAQPTKTNTLAIVALVLGGLGFLTGLIPVVGLVFGAAGVVFAIIALVKHQNKLMAIIGGAAGLVGAITSIIMLAIVMAITPALTDPTPTAEPTPAESTPTEETETEPTEEPEAEPTEEPAEEPPAPSESLADTVWAQIEAAFPDGISTESPLFTVTDVEDVSTGTIRVHVQDNLTADGRDMVARHIYNMGALNNPDLTTVVVRDVSGRDSNHHRSRYPHLN